jgi:alpha-D-glucose phosphate-specific phosphoglucomutase
LLLEANVTQIKFGTSGWRGILAEDFTFENVKIVTQAIADALRGQGLGERGVVIGYDARFMGNRFAEETARVLAGAGIKALLCKRDTPTPVLAHEILRRGADGGINFTASHNPYDYNGLKFSPAWGGPALPETTGDIEARANAMLGEFCYREMSLHEGRKKGLVEDIDPHDAYCAALRKLVDFPALGRAGLQVAVNPMYGTGRGYLDQLLREAGVEVVTINDHTDPYFGGLPPEPAEANIQDFIALVKSDPKICLGVATDGDADRYGIIDADGSYVEPNYILALLTDYLVRFRGESGAVARSVATSHFLDAVARHHRLEVLETPVGFKYIGEYIRDNRIAIGGEESAGLTVRGHVPDKDGILACLLVAEMVAVTGKTLQELLADLYARVGEFYTRRINLHLTPTLDTAYAAKLAAQPDSFGGLRVLEKVVIDGNKFLLENDAWVLFRKSGTEPVVRVYGEARQPAILEKILAAAEQFILH